MHQNEVIKRHQHGDIVNCTQCTQCTCYFSHLPFSLRLLFVDGGFCYSFLLKMSVKNIFEFDKLFKNEEYSDFAFIVSNDSDEPIRIPAHKIILSAKSRFFNRLFYGELNKEPANSMKITNTFIEAFDDFLKLFYVNEIEIRHVYLEEVSALIEKFKAPSLRGAVGEKFIEERAATLTDILQYYDMAIKLNLSDPLKQMLWSTICSRPADIM